MSNWIKEYFQLPNDWKLEKLKDLTHLIIDGTHHTPTYVEHGVPFLRVTDVQSKEIDKSKLKYVTKKEHKVLIKRCNPEKGDILYSKNGSIGIPKIVDWDWEFSIFVSLALLKLKKGINPTYVKFLLQSDLIKKQIHKRAKQGTVTNLHLEEIRELELPRSSDREETKIAHILTTLDNVIEKTEAAIAKYEAIKRGMMHDLFTRGIGADGRLRPAYADAPALYKESALGWIPREWEVNYLREYANVQGGYAFPSIDYTESGVQLIRIGNLFDNKLSLTRDPVFLPKKHIKLFPQFVLKDGDIIMSMTGTSGKRDYGFAVKIKNVGNVFLLNQRVCRFDHKDNIESDFLLNLLHTELYLRPLYSSAGGTKQANLNGSNILNIHVPIPDIQEQKVICTRLNRLRSLITKETQTLAKQTQLKRGLMQDLLTGKVAVEV